MSSGTNKVFPILLDILSHKPHLEENHKVLFKNLKSKLAENEINIKKVRDEFESAIKIGQSLGVMRVQEENVILPIQMKNKRKQSSSSLDKSEEEEEAEDPATDKPLRTRRRRRSRSGVRRSRSTSRRSRSRGSRSRGGRRRR